MSDISTYCQQCHMKCCVTAAVRNGVITAIRNASCPKGVHAHEVLYHPDRIRQPLLRAAGRGEGGWQTISWDEAMGIMAQRFGEIGRQWGTGAIATIYSCFHKEQSASATALFSYLLGTPNVLDVNHQCTTPDVMAQVFTVGERIHSDQFPDYRRSRCILLWGANPTETQPAQARDILYARDRGAKLIVVDPRPIDMAARADIWLRLRPGTDGALALAMVNTVIREGLYDRDFVEKWCVGFEALEKHVRQYTPAWAASVTWVPEEDIVAAARLYATIRPACLHTRLGSGAQHINATQDSRTISILVSLTGCIDVEGGNLLGDRLGGFRRIQAIPRLLRPPGEVWESRIGAKQFPLAGNAHTPSCVKAMLRGDIRAFYVPGSNFVVNEGDSREVWEALKRLDFMAVAELFMTPTAELADLVLPAAHWLETDTPLDARRDMGENMFNYIMAAPRVVEPQADCRDDRLVVLELARRMGLKSPWQTVADFNNWRLEKVGVKFDELAAMPDSMLAFPVQYRSYEKRGFLTPSGKVELYSSVLEKAGYDPLPRYIEPPESPVTTPGLAREYPFILTTFRHKAYEHTEYRQIASLRRLLPEPLIEINPDSAAGLGISEGETVWLSTPGLPYRVRGKARLVPGLHPNVVGSLFGWWFPEEPGPEHGCFEANVNAIIAAGPPYEPVNGNYHARGVLCRVERQSTGSLSR